MFTLIFKRKQNSFMRLLLPLLIAILLSGCKKGYDKYCSKENPKTGFIYDKVKSVPNFTTFAEGLERADLAKYVNVSGLYTVFAPTKEAFQKYFQRMGYSSINDVPVNTLFSI